MRPDDTRNRPQPLDRVGEIGWNTPVTLRHRLSASVLALFVCGIVAAGCGSPVSVGTGGSTETTTTVAASGVVGTVTAGPTCPVEVAGEPCPPHPVSAEIDVRDRKGATVAKTRSSADGQYRLALAPGEYTLVVVTDTFPLCPETPVSVKSGLYTTADISCDTGIR
jgi:hypothetical protein